MADMDSSPSWRRTTAPLANAIFLRFWIAGMVSNFGTMMQTVATAWLMTSITSSARMVALVQTAATIPVMLFALLAGALADIVDRRKLMLVAQIGMAVVALLLAFVTSIGGANASLLLAATFLIATGNALYAPAWQASVVEQVSHAQLEAASSLNSVGFNVARSMGPAVGGALVAIWGSACVFALNGLSNLGLVATILSWRRKRPEGELPPERVIEAVFSGLRYASLSPQALTLLIRASAFGFCGSCVWALTPVLAHDALGGGPLTLGVLLGGFGFGAVVGAILRANLGLSRPRLVGFCTLMSGAATIVLAITPFVAPAILLMALIGGCWVAALTSLGVSIQLSVPRWVVGRMIALNQMAVFAGMGIGSFLWGSVAQAFGVRTAFLSAGMTMALSLVLARRFPLSAGSDPDIRPVRTTPLDSGDAPLQDGEGPIVITLLYQVSTEKAADFAAAMEELGRVRQRDGARRWSLQQNLDNPREWQERYISTNWLHHLRRQIRPTQADQRIRDHVASLHDGSPVVTRMLERSRGGPPFRGTAPFKLPEI
ncbi:MFS transporter [Sphingobium sp.]|uniref:MFS transporter n=1 Tax=Sphingobium sp. TaxID=1912891 RepID=UPI0028BE7E6A|nr:MFS transporter [Sphingobium sp.]